MGVEVEVGVEVGVEVEVEVEVAVEVAEGREDDAKDDDIAFVSEDVVRERLPSFRPRLDMMSAGIHRHREPPQARWMRVIVDRHDGIPHIGRDLDRQRRDACAQVRKEWIFQQVEDLVVVLALGFVARLGVVRERGRGLPQLLLAERDVVANPRGQLHLRDPAQASPTPPSSGPPPRALRQPRRARARPAPARASAEQWAREAPALPCRSAPARRPSMYVPAPMRAPAAARSGLRTRYAASISWGPM